VVARTFSEQITCGTRKCRWLLELAKSWDIFRYFCLKHLLCPPSFQTKTRFVSLLFCNHSIVSFCRSQRPRGLRRRSAAARLLRSWVRIAPGAWMSVCCECCVFSGRGLCDELIPRQEESYRLWCDFVCDLETMWMRRPWPTEGSCAKSKKKVSLV